MPTTKLWILLILMTFGVDKYSNRHKILNLCKIKNLLYNKIKKINDILIRVLIKNKIFKFLKNY